jgi:hypothetical protein
MLADLTGAHNRLTDAANGALDALERVNAAEAAAFAKMDAGLSAMIAAIDAAIAESTAEVTNKDAE